MNEHVILDMARQRNAEQREAARLAGLAREGRAARRARRRRDRELAAAIEAEVAGLLPLPDYVDARVDA